MNVGIWIRVSTDMQAQGESPENHRDRAKYYCKAKKDWKIVETYDLSGVSGKSVIEHPEAKRMLADVASGKIKALVFSKLARLARNVKELLEISEHFKQHNACLVSIDESLDTSTPAGKLLYTVIGALAEWERGEISARAAAAIPVRAREGRRIGGMQPFGYHWIDKHNLVPKEEDALIVRKAFELFAQHKKMKYVRDLLNESGHRTKKAKWSDTTLKRMLVNEVYIGKYRRNYSKSKGEKKSWEWKPESEWIVIDVEPLISKELWDEVQSVFSTRTQVYSTGVPKEGKFLFSGILNCECGGKMYVSSYKSMTIPRYACMKCKNRAWEDGLTDYVLQALRSIVVQPELLKSPDDQGEVTTRKRYELETAQRELVKNKKAIEKTFGLFEDGNISKELIVGRLQPLELRQQQLRDEVYRLEAELSNLEQTEVGRQYLISQAQTLAAMWDVLSEDDRRRLLRELLLEIRVGLLKEEVQSLEIAFSFLPQLMENTDDSGVEDTCIELATNNHSCATNSLLYIAKAVIRIDSKPKGYSSQPVTLGEHIRKVRLDRGLYHKDIANAVGVSICSINNWENGHGEPEIRFIPKIIEFLGYNPRPMPTGILEKLAWYKWSQGLNYEALGERMRIHHEQLQAWLVGRQKPFNKSLARIDEFLAFHCRNA
jgi:site-specific DNA recombinase